MITVFRLVTVTVYKNDHATVSVYSNYEVTSYNFQKVIK